LSAGDVIATGTPCGVGFTRKQPIYLKPGGEVAVEIEKVGTLVNPIVAGMQVFALSGHAPFRHMSLVESYGKTTLKRPASLSEAGCEIYFNYMLNNN
jgi:hypothetical protein